MKASMKAKSGLRLFGPATWPGPGPARGRERGRRSGGSAAPREAGPPPRERGAGSTALAVKTGSKG